MDTCFVDITVEFLSVAFHNILYYTAVYPKSIFETRKKYSVVVYRSIHPEVNQYIDLCLKSIAVCLKNGQLNRVEFCVTNNSYESLVKFVFNIEKLEYFDETTDAYLIQVEQNLRAFCLTLAGLRDKMPCLGEDCSFTIHMHTNESTAVAAATNPDLEDFPLVEVDEKGVRLEKIVPLRSFDLRHHRLDVYVEIG